MEFAKIDGVCSLSESGTIFAIGEVKDLVVDCEIYNGSSWWVSHILVNVRETNGDSVKLERKYLLPSSQYVSNKLGIPCLTIGHAETKLGVVAAGHIELGEGSKHESFWSGKRRLQTKDYSLEVIGARGRKP